MARDEQSNGNGRSNGSSGKSGRQDSPLSTRRARLRSLARQALPPDPYSKGKEEEQSNPGDALELEPMDRSEDASGGQGATATAQAPQPDPWLEQSIKLLSPGINAQSSSGEMQPADPTPRSPEFNLGQFPGGQAFSTGQVQYNQPDPSGGGGFPAQAPAPGFDYSQVSHEGSFAHPPSGLMFSQSGPATAQPDFRADHGQEFGSQQSFEQHPGEYPASYELQSGNPWNDQEPSNSPQASDYSSNETVPQAASATEAPADTAFGSFVPYEPAPSASFSSNDFSADYAPAYNPHYPQVQSPTEADENATVNNGTPSADSVSIDEAPPTTGSQMHLSADTIQDEAQQENQDDSQQNPPSKRRRGQKRSDLETAESSESVSPGVLSPGVLSPGVLSPGVLSPGVLSPGVLSSEQDRASQSNQWQVPEKASEESEENPANSEEKGFPGKESFDYSREEPQATPPSSHWDDASSSTASADEHLKSAPKNEPDPIPMTQSNSQPGNTSLNYSVASSIPPVPSIPIEVLTKSQVEALELLTSIDQALGVCAMNLSSIQTTASEQTEALRNLKETLQNQTFFEIGLNLNTLMESMSAALEPMKAVGELVPAIDQLVSTMVSREEREKESRVSPDRLVMALADQLGNGAIDPWTFRCAYMAVYPDEHPANLLHRLVELLGTQRLSGELFRAAYDAVQAAEPPRDSTTGSVREVVKVVPDPEVVRQLDETQKQFEELRRNHEELKRNHDEVRRLNDELRTIAQEKDSGATASLEEREKEFEQREIEFKRRLDEREQELLKRLEERESEYADLLAAKEQEIQDTQDMLHSRFEEFNSRYEELVETVNQRDEELKAKEEELSRKESEVGQLKAQLDEIKEQFRETVEDMQKQLASSQKLAEQASKQAAAVAQAATTAAVQPDERKSSGFFDAEPKTGFMDSGPARPLFQQQMDTFNSMSRPPQPAPPAPPTPVANEPQASFAPSPPTAPLPEPPSNQAVPRPPQSQSIGPLTQGSYGSGVRAQVFEVIVRQALAGAPWKEICAGPMQVNNITAEEVEAEVRRRETLLKK